MASFNISSSNESTVILTCAELVNFPSVTDTFSTYFPVSKPEADVSTPVRSSIVNKPWCGSKMLYSSMSYWSWSEACTRPNSPPFHRSWYDPTHIFRGTIVGGYWDSSITCNCKTTYLKHSTNYPRFQTFTSYKYQSICNANSTDICPLPVIVLLNCYYLDDQLCVRIPRRYAIIEGAHFHHMNVLHFELQSGCGLHSTVGIDSKWPFVLGRNVEREGRTIRRNIGIGDIQLADRPTWSFVLLPTNNAQFDSSGNLNYFRLIRQLIITCTTHV